MKWHKIVFAIQINERKRITEAEKHRTIKASLLYILLQNKIL
jgi:hypothetical protein